MTKRLENLQPTLRMIYLTAADVTSELAVLYKTLDDFFNEENGYAVDLHNTAADEVYGEVGVVAFKAINGHIHAYMRNGEVVGNDQITDRKLHE